MAQELDARAAWNLADTMRRPTAERQRETQATVARVDSDGGVWVHLPNGVAETPVAAAYAEASVGDVVLVTVADGSVTLVANSTPRGSVSATRQSAQGGTSVVVGPPAAPEVTQTLTGYGTNYFHAHGYSATLMCTGTSKTGAWTSTTLCTVPEGWRPWTQLYFHCQKDGDGNQSDTYVTVATDGTVTLQNSGGTQVASVYRATCTWTI